MGCLRLIILTLVIVQLKAEDIEYESDPNEVMIAQESRHYQTVVEPPIRIVKPSGVTNSHRPQYNLDSYEGGFEDYLDLTTRKSFVKNYKSSNNIRSKEGTMKDAVFKALERKDHVGKFAQLLPIVRAMSGSQRVALASLVASQVSTPPGRAPLNLAQVRSMFSNNVNNSSELMLPILLDMANMIRQAVRSGKEPREPQMLRRSFTDDGEPDEPFDTSSESTTKATKIRIRRIIPQRTIPPKTNTPLQQDNRTDTNSTSQADTDDSTVEDNKNITKSTTLATIDIASNTTSVASSRVRSDDSRSLTDNATVDLLADSTNQTLAQDLPVAEKLRLNLNRYIDRNGNHIRRGTYPPKPSSVLRRTTAEPTLSSIRRRPPPARKLPITTTDKAKCELFTNSLCLQADDYPTEAIVQSIRRNKAAAGALLADFRDPAEGAVDGITAAQEEQYTAEHYLVSNRRGDTLNRDFAGAGEAGFMCPSTVKYARPQRARATSGQWKYIVNTGEHTQTLRLEKCLKPKEACTYLTDNFKSKCVQVYNYHRLLTWDQQNGLHMDIFKVPTCCSCHIEGYSVSFPPLGHRVHETSSEHFPGEDISAEQGNNAFESVQSTIQRPVSKNPPFTHSKPLETFPPFSDNQNQLIGTSFNSAKFIENNETILSSNTADSFGNSYFPDSFNQASSIRNVKRPPLGRNPVGNSFDSVTLPSYLEPPTIEASSSFNFVKDLQSKIKNTGIPFKRGAVRPSRRPIRKKITGGPEDLVSSGTSVLESFTGSSVESPEVFNEYLEEPDIGQAASPSQPRITIAPKLHAVSLEKGLTTAKPKEKQRMNHSYITNGKRINYNYHPIIDFFGEEEKGEEEITDREDSVPSYIPALESEWKPINNPPNSNIQNGNLLDRKKH